MTKWCSISFAKCSSIPELITEVRRKQTQKANLKKRWLNRGIVDCDIDQCSNAAQNIVIIFLFIFNKSINSLKFIIHFDHGGIK